MKEHVRYPMIISRAEMITIVDINLHAVPSKVDTGAYRSAIHAANISVVQTDAGEALSFDLLEGHKCATGSAHVETHRFKQVQVENSFGHTEMRYEVFLRVKIGPKVFSSSFTLADRSKKIYPVLLGRKFLRRRFLIDVNNSNIDRRLLKEKFGVQLPIDEEVVYLEEA